MGSGPREDSRGARLETGRSPASLSAQLQSPAAQRDLQEPLPPQPSLHTLTVQGSPFWNAPVPL